MTKIIYTSVHPHTTWRLKVSFSVKKPPTKLIADLDQAGWCVNEFGAPPCNGTQEVDITYPGTDLFNSWKPKEREEAMSKARKVLAKHGHEVVPYHKLEMADCL